MALTVLDSNNLDAILADARGEVVEKAVATAKPEDKEIKADEIKADEHHEDDPDDLEGEDGLTPRQKRELTAKILKSIGKKHRQVKEAEEFAAAQYNERKMAEQRAEEVMRELNEIKSKSQPVIKDETNERPQRQAFGSEDEYIDAMIKYGVNEGLNKERQEAQKRQDEARQQEIISQAKARIERAVELVPDFKDVTSSVDVAIPEAVARYMQRSEMFAEIGYHFAKNPELVTSLSKLPVDEQLVKLGKIESTLKPFGEKPSESSHGDKPSNESSNGKSTKTPSENTANLLSKPRTEAPVIKPISDSGTAANEIDPDKIRDVIADFAKRNEINFTKRKRH